MPQYKLEYKESALKEWKALDSGIREQFRSKLKERLVNPHVPSAALNGMKNCYKIKLRSAGYRLVYEVNDGTITVVVVAVGKRSRNEVYRKAKNRL